MEAGGVVTSDRFDLLLARGVVLDEGNIQIISDSGGDTKSLHRETCGSAEYKIINDTLAKDLTNNSKDAVTYIYRLLRILSPRMRPRRVM